MGISVADTIDLDRLMANISEDSPCGSDLRQDFSLGSLYLKIKDARSEARRLERVIDMDGDGASPDGAWEVVFSTGIEILSAHAKDLEIAAWVAEAAVRLEGLEAFGAMLALSKYFIDTYWDDIFPLPDEDGFEGRIAPFVGLNGANDDSPVVQCIRRLPLTDAAEHFGLWDYQKALELGKITDEAARAERIEMGVPTLEKFNEAVALTPGVFYLDLLASINDVREKLDALYDAFHDRVGVDAPPAGGIRKALDEIEDSVNLFARNKIERAQAALQSGDGSFAVEGATQDNGANVDVMASSSPRALVESAGFDREEAFRQLLRISDFFRKNEPHSPVSYVLEELVRRGRMPLPELLNELIIDGEARRYYLIASGIGLSGVDPVEANVQDE